MFLESLGLRKGAASGRVLTSDAQGNATWAAPGAFVSDTAPVNPPARYAWFQTGLGPDGTGITLWVEDGT